MKKLIIFLLVISGSILFFSGCQSTSGALPMIAGIDSSNTTIHIAPNSEFVIYLPENPTTGYTWSLTQYDKNVLELEKSSYSPADESHTKIGAGGLHWFFFKAQDSGTTPVVLNLSRPWEKDKKPSKVAQYIVVIQ